jgi:trimethylamine--corrinoid protein Co-methyltransferase
MDNEFSRMIKHTLNGFSINKDTLAVDVIHQIGPAKDFLMHAHTFKHMRSQSIPELIDRKGKEEWKSAGGKDIYAKAAEKARNILDNHKPESLPENAATKIRSIIKDTEEELGISKK